MAFIATANQIASYFTWKRSGR